MTNPLIVFYWFSFLKCTFFHFAMWQCSPPRYTEKAYTVQQEDTVLNIWFVTVDCSPIKSSLAQLCSEWQTRFTELLSHMACTHLKELHSSLQDNANRWDIKWIILFGDEGVGITGTWTQNCQVKFFTLVQAGSKTGCQSNRRTNLKKGARKNPRLSSQANRVATGRSGTQSGYTEHLAVTHKSIWPRQV